MCWEVGRRFGSWGHLKALGLESIMSSCFLQAKTSGKFSDEELDKLWREFKHHKEKIREYNILLETVSRTEGAWTFLCCFKISTTLFSAHCFHRFQISLELLTFLSEPLADAGIFRYFLGLVLISCQNSCQLMKMLPFQFSDSACVPCREDAIRLQWWPLKFTGNYAASINPLLQNVILKSAEHPCFISLAGCPTGDTEYLRQQAWSLLEHQGSEPSFQY